MSDQPPKTAFKGWTIPGPLPPRVLDQPIGEDETLDALAGHFRIIQLKNGHRFSTDDILTAWYGTSWAPSARRVLDLGSGIGSVGMTAAWRLCGANFVTVEAQEISVALARRSARYNGLEERYEIRCGDFRNPAILQEDEKFDLVLGSPPYFPLGSGIEGDHPQKIACRFELRGDVGDYCRTAARHLSGGGLFTRVFPLATEQLERVWQAAKSAELSIVRWRPVVFREGEAPLIGLFAMMKAVDLPEWFRGMSWQEPPLIIRDSRGAVHPEYSAVKLTIGFPP